MPEKPVTCPTAARFSGDLVGCGSAKLAGPDDEGFYDCLNCGLWFRKERTPKCAAHGGKTKTVTGTRIARTFTCSPTAGL